jgi:hypothetical protein
MYSAEFSEEQWTHVGKCIDCGASLYSNGLRVIPGEETEPGHICLSEEALDKMMEEMEKEDQKFKEMVGV